MDEEENENEQGTNTNEGGDDEVIQVTRAQLSEIVDGAVTRALSKRNAQPDTKPTGKDGKPSEATLKARMDALEADNRAKDAAIAQTTRENHLRKLIETHGVADIDIALRGIIPELTVEDGEFKAFDGHIPIDLEKFVGRFISARPFLTAETSREGGGHVGRSAHRPGNQKPKIDPKLKGLDKCRAAIAAGLHKD